MSSGVDIFSAPAATITNNRKHANCFVIVLSPNRQTITGWRNGRANLCRPRRTGLAYEPKTFAFRIVLHLARIIKYHRGALFRGVRRPVRQPAVARLAGSRETGPRLSDG